MGLIRLLIQWLVLGMLLWIVLSYVVVFGRVGWDHPVRKVYDALSKIIEPLLRPIRAVIPPVRIGGAALDLSPLILIIGLQIIARLL
ncbi:MAG: YggT family protein [Actinomycetota bacterium]|nr:YggT family protein [Actinomycetota bacterium]MDK1038015.1 YggT family protein [Actinomycetota bacterium]MDK1096099.1 YggT family protein [Actinomycetota bacterium]MDK1291021.1 YggT family protein [Actinomycetota bacterium]